MRLTVGTELALNVFAVLLVRVQIVSEHKTSLPNTTNKKR